MKYKIAGIEKGLTLEDVRKRIDKGGEFVVFPYTISIITMTFRLFSRAYLIADRSEIKKLRRKYIFLTILFGWWGLPWGPIYSIKALRLSGGVDMTGDIMLNIDEDSFNSRRVELIKTEDLFCQPNKQDIKAFKKMVEKYFERDYTLRKLVVGWSINTESPHHTVGISTDADFDDCTAKVQEALYAYFRRHTYFEFINLREDTFERPLLEKQGVVILQRR